jgi:uncharacterized membrane protein YebE (DUF533 family)
VAASLAIAPAAVEAKGCLRGMIAGSVAGHYAGHHAVLGAVGGCVAGRAYYNHKAKVQTRQAQAVQPQNVRHY